MSKELSIKERVSMLLEDYHIMETRAEKAEAEVKRLTFALEQTQWALEESVKDNNGRSLEEYGAALDRAEKAEAEIASLKQRLAETNGVNAYKITGLPYAVPSLSSSPYQNCPECGKYCCEFSTYFKRLCCRACGFMEPPEMMRPSHWAPYYSQMVIKGNPEIEKLRMQQEVDQLRGKLIYAKSNLEQYKNAYKLKVEQHDFDKNSWKLLHTSLTKRIEELEELND